MSPRDMAIRQHFTARARHTTLTGKNKSFQTYAIVLQKELETRIVCSKEYTVAEVFLIFRAGVHALR